MPEGTNGSGQVVYSVKEILGQIQDKLENIDAKLNVKADRVEVEHVLLRIQQLESPRTPTREETRLLVEFRTLQDAVAELKTRDKVTDALRSQVRWLFGIGVTLAAGIVTNGIINYLQLTGKHP